MGVVSAGVAYALGVLSSITANLISGATEGGESGEEIDEEHRQSLIVIAELSNDVKDREAEIDFLRATYPQQYHEIKRLILDGNIDGAFKAAARLSDSIIVGADKSRVKIFGAFLEAKDGIIFDHETGVIRIGDVNANSKSISIGGSQNSQGMTEITDSLFQTTQGSSIDVGEGAEIKLTGNASIKMK